MLWIYVLRLSVVRLSVIHMYVVHALATFLLSNDIWGMGNVLRNSSILE